MELWLTFLVIVQLCRATPLGSSLGMRPRRAEDRVTIDLSALRPSLPGLVLYKYGEMAPKLVQVDLSSLNPQLKPHVIWPQFNQMDLFDDKPFDDLDAIPYLTEEHSLMNPRRLAKVTEWMDDFAPTSEQLLSLHESLPLADEVIVPLDWEEKKGGKKRNPTKQSNPGERMNVLFTPAGVVSMDRHKDLEREGKTVIMGRQPLGAPSRRILISKNAANRWK